MLAARLPEQCMDMAERADPDMRKTMLRMAEVWLELATEVLPSLQIKRPPQNAPSSEKVELATLAHTSRYYGLLR